MQVSKYLASLLWLEEPQPLSQVLLSKSDFLGDAQMAGQLITVSMGQYKVLQTIASLELLWEQMLYRHLLSTHDSKAIETMISVPLA